MALNEIHSSQRSVRLNYAHGDWVPTIKDTLKDAVSSNYASGTIDPNSLTVFINPPPEFIKILENSFTEGIVWVLSTTRILHLLNLSRWRWLEFNATGSKLISSTVVGHV